MKYELKYGCDIEVTVQPRLELYTVQDFMGTDMLGLAIILDDVTNPEEPKEFCSLTISFGEFIGMKNSAYIDIENCPFIDQLLKQGMAQDTGLTKRDGFYDCPLWLFEENMLKSMGEDNYNTYDTAYRQYMAKFGME